MIRNRVAPGRGHKKSAQCANRHSRTGSPMRGVSQTDQSSDETDTGPIARSRTGVKLKCILSTHG